jgi:hypothetical protein
MADSVMKRIVCVIVLWLTSCQVQKEVRETAAPTGEATADVVTATPDAVPSPTIEATAVIEHGDPEYPVFPDGVTLYSLVLSEANSCELPCWHGLRVREATQEEAQRVFAEVFDTPDDYSFFPLEQGDDAGVDNTIDVPGTYAGGLYTVFANDTMVVGYNLVALFDENTGRLTGLQEDIHQFPIEYDNENPVEIFVLPSVPEVLAQFGLPDWIYVNLDRMGVAQFLTVIYQEGLTITFQHLQDMYTVCYDEPPDSVRIRLSDPFASTNPDDLTAFQKDRPYPEHPAPYISPELGVATIKEFSLFVQGKDPCIMLPE